MLEGYVEPGERRREGPFGDHTGLYSQPDDFPVFHITCITRRKKPTYLTTVVGIPPMEDFYLGLASERIFLPMIRKTLPEIVDMHFPAEGIFHNLVLVSIDKRYPGPRAQDHERVLGTRSADVLEDDHRRRQGRRRPRPQPGRLDRRHALRSAARRPDDQGAGRRSGRCRDLPAYGGKMGIDATRKWASEGYTRSWPARVVTTEAAGRRAAEILSKLHPVASSSVSGFDLPYAGPVRLRKAHRRRVGAADDDADAFAFRGLIRARQHRRERGAAAGSTTSRAYPTTSAARF